MCWWLLLLLLTVLWGLASLHQWQVMLAISLSILSILKTVVLWDYRRSSAAGRTAKNTVKVPLLYAGLTVSILLLLAGCSKAWGGRKQYMEIHQSAAAVLPAAVEMEKMFGTADHCITHYGMRGEETNTWNTEVFFGDRYSLTLQVPVKVDYANNRVAVAGEPKFFLLEHKRISVGGWSSRSGDQRWLTADDWRKVVESNGDFTVLAINLNVTPVANFSDYVHGIREPRIPVSLITAQQKGK